MYVQYRLWYKNKYAYTLKESARDTHDIIALIDGNNNEYVVDCKQNTPYIFVYIRTIAHLTTSEKNIYTFLVLFVCFFFHYFSCRFAFSFWLRSLFNTLNSAQQACVFMYVHCTAFVARSKAPGKRVKKNELIKMNTTACVTQIDLPFMFIQFSELDFLRFCAAQNWLTNMKTHFLCWRFLDSFCQANEIKKKLAIYEIKNFKLVFLICDTAPGSIPRIEHRPTLFTGRSTFASHSNLLYIIKESHPLSASPTTKFCFSSCLGIDWSICVRMIAWKQWLLTQIIQVNYIHSPPFDPPDRAHFFNGFIWNFATDSNGE